ncbi:MAG: hypothetical protein E7581_05345 [Ruminococcaceae bacterium]|nr:hypothetical protein [Oscillospiraceae bacterium]
MRKMQIYIAIVCFLALIAGATSCNTNSQDENNTEPPHYDRIEVHSLAELNEMRSMIDCDDPDELKEYLLRVHGDTLDGTPISKEDLVYFVSRVDKLPYVNLLEGEIVWIHYLCGKSKDTGLPVDVIELSIQANNGDWVSIDYLFSENDVEGRINAMKAEAKHENLISTPLYSQDGKVVFHIETREENPSGSGDIIRWFAEIDGIFTSIRYCTSNANNVDTAALVSDLKISNIPSQATSE